MIILPGKLDGIYEVGSLVKDLSVGAGGELEARLYHGHHSTSVAGMVTSLLGT